MKDDWNLSCESDIDGECAWYNVIDIETLRKKLIEDFMKLVAHKIPLEEVEIIINKRFGVKE